MSDIINGDHNYKLYVWEGFEPDYTGGLAIAIAKTEEEARKLILDKEDIIYEWGTLTIHDIDKPYVSYVYGEG